MPGVKLNIFKRIFAALRSPRGKDALMFLVFLCISMILWSVLSLNEEDQSDLRMPVRITHVPDSVTLITPGPEALNVSLRAKGTSLLKMALGSAPQVDIDFRAYRSGGYLRLTSADLKALVRNASGGAQVSLVYPDSINIPYTTHPGYLLPIVVDYKATAGPQAVLIGKPRLNVDSARVFLWGNDLPENLENVVTEPIRLIGLEHSETRKVRIFGPTGSRVIPDSVEVYFQVEPLIFKTRKVAIEPVNVPKNTKLITFPAQIDVAYLIPMSEYATSDTHFRVVADYRTLQPGTRRIKLSLQNVASNLKNVHLSADSAEYIIERQ